MDIISQENPNFDEKLMTYASLLHDVCDHKYPDSIPFTEL
jgi:hypothetical protein